jgi:Flp pilus assembly protein TadD
MRPALCASLLVGLLLAAHFDSVPAFAGTPDEPEVSETQRAHHARRLLRDARAFLRQDRVDAAERALRRALAVSPDDARLHDLLARVLAKQGRAEEAARHRRRANELVPPPPPLPATALEVSSRRIVVALLPPANSTERPDRVPSDWPDGIAAKTLEHRLRLRLPLATIAHASPQTVAEARSWLAERSPRGAISLRIDRSYCADTLKDGRFAVAWLRAVPGEPSEGPDERREVVLNPRLPGDCRAEALRRALERVFRHPVVRRALEAPPLPAARRSPAAQGARWSTTAIRALFPGLGERIKAELDAGRAQLATGRVAAAAETFRRATQIDPEDPVVLAYLAEARSTLAMARELAFRRDPASIREEDLGVLDPRFSPAQRAVAEARLADERRRRDDLLAAREVLGEDVRVPERDTLAALRPGEIRDPEAFGPSTARARAGGEVEVRVAYAPDGSEIARYYLPAVGGKPVLREEDTNGDGRPDRWIAYYGAARSDVWEDGRATGMPDLHFVFALGGDPIERIELESSTASTASTTRATWRPATKTSTETGNSTRGASTAEAGSWSAASGSWSSPPTTSSPHFSPRLVARACRFVLWREISEVGTGGVPVGTSRSRLSKSRVRVRRCALTVETWREMRAGRPAHSGVT